MSKSPTYGRESSSTWSRQERARNRYYKTSDSAVTRASLAVVAINKLTFWDKWSAVQRPTTVPKNEEERVRVTFYTNFNHPVTVTDEPYHYRQNL